MNLLPDPGGEFVMVLGPHLAPEARAARGWRGLRTRISPIFLGPYAGFHYLTVCFTTGEVLVR